MGKKANRNKEKFGAVPTTNHPSKYIYLNEFKKNLCLETGRETDDSDAESVYSSVAGEYQSSIGNFI